MPTPLECRCCHEVHLIDQMVEESELNCITEQECFEVNCLNRHVLRVSLHEFVQYNGPVGDNEPIHE